MPQLATADLRGSTLREVAPRGKHILARFDNGLSLHSHLRMDGKWRVARGRRPAGGPPSAIRVVLTTEDHVAIGYRVHDVAIVRTEDEQSLADHQEWCLADAEANTRLLNDVAVRNGELTQEALVAASKKRRGLTRPKHPT